MTRKHFKAIASIIRANTYKRGNQLIINHNDIIDDLCDIFASDNSLFNKQLFVNACNDDNV